MPISKQRIDLINIILEDDVTASEEDDILQILLQEHVSQDTISEHEKMLTVGQKAADSVAKFTGSWIFILLFFVILGFWILLNAIFLTKPYDVYPFILLNLILSCLAAIQAPVIMMSQNRREQKDRLRAKNDFKVNLKAEIIIEAIHQKLDIIIEAQEGFVGRLASLEKNDPE